HPRPPSRQRAGARRGGERSRPRAPPARGLEPPGARAAARGPPASGRRAQGRGAAPRHRPPELLVLPAQARTRPGGTLKRPCLAAALFFLLPLAARPTPPTFEDVTAAAGIRFKHTSGATGKKYLPETMGSGCAFLDYDNDGRQDILLVNSMEWT